MNSEDLLVSQNSHQDDAVSQHQSNFSDQSSNKFTEFIQSLSPAERLLELDYQHLQANFSIKEPNFSLTLNAAEKYYSHILQKNKQIADKRLKKNWTDDETSLLLWIVEVFSNRLNMDPADFESSSWVEIAEMIPFKAFDNCRLRWLYLKKNCIQGVPWTQEEDDCLIQIIKKKGTDSNKWNEIAKELQNTFSGKSFRKGKQCRERWNNHLDPDMKRGDWTCQEDLKLLQLSYQKGNKWSYIARQLQERTENAVKNRYKSLIRKEEKELKIIQKNETIQEYNYSPEELIKLIGVDSVENQSPDQLKLLGIIRKLYNSIEESQDENAIEIEDDANQIKEQCTDDEVKLKDNQEQCKSQVINESTTPTSTKTDSTPKIEFSNNKINILSTSTLQHSIFSPISSPNKPLFSTIQNTSLVESSTKLIAPHSSDTFDQQKNNIKASTTITTEKSKKYPKQKKESKKKPEVSTFSDAFLKEKNTAKRGSQESNFSNSTASSFSQGIQLATQQFPHRTSIQSCDTPGGTSAYSNNHFYSPLLPSASPCSLLIQQFSNLGFSSCENTPTVKRRNTCLNGSDPLQTLMCLDIIHKQRKLSSMAEEQEILSPSSISTPSNKRKVIVLAKDTSLLDEHNNHEPKTQIIKNVPMEMEMKTSNGSSQEPTVSAKSHSQISSDDSLSSQDDFGLCTYPNLLQYSGPNKSAFRQFLSPLQVSKPSPQQYPQIQINNQDNTPSNNPFSQINKISPLLLCPPQTTTTQPMKQLSQGFTKNKNFKTLLTSVESKQDHQSFFKQSSQTTPLQLSSSSSFQSVSKEVSKIE